MYIRIVLMNQTQRYDTFFFFFLKKKTEEGILNVSVLFGCREKLYKTHTRFLFIPVLKIAMEASSVPFTKEDEDSGGTVVKQQQKTLSDGRAFATKPYSWDELVDIICHKQDVSLLTRSVEQQEIYNVTLKQLKQEWESMADYILYSKFQFDKVLSKQTQKWKINHEETTTTKKDVVVQTRLVLNDFPYYFPTHIQHWIYWKLYGDITQQDIDKAKQDLIQKMKINGDHNDNNTLHWINPPHLKSLPDIDHVHILVRTSTNTSK